MSTRTLDVLQAGGPYPPLYFVLEIEGYPSLLASGPSTTSVLAAYEDTEWTSCILGLAPPQGYRQEMRPFKPSLDGGSMSFRVYPSIDADTFAVDVWAQALATGKQGLLQASIDADDTALTLDDADEFAASGALHLGIERVEYSSRDTGTEVFTLSKRGTYAPWKADSETLPRYGRPHRIGTVQTAKHFPVVTDYYRDWAGRTVRLNVHVAETSAALNIRSYAYKAFGGRIADISEDTDGALVIACTDAVEMVGGATVFREQWRAKVPEGLYVGTWMTGLTSARESWIVATAGVPSGSGGGTTTGLVVVASGATPPAELDAGYYTADDLCAAVNAWIAGDGSLVQTWHLGLVWDAGLGGWRAEISVAFATSLGGNGSHAAIEFSMHREWAMFLGFVPVGTGPGVVTLSAAQANGNTGVILRIRGEYPPMRVRAFQAGQVPGETLAQLDAEGASGIWINQRTTLPDPLRTATGGSGSWGLLRIGGQNIALAEYTSDTLLGVIWIPPLARMFGADSTQAIAGLEAPTIYYGEAGDIEVEQILAIQGNMKTLVMSLICSTGTAGYNHATWDAYPYGLGAEVPYEMLGDAFEASVDQLATMTSDASLTVLLDRPTLLAEILLPEMYLRNAHLVWDQGLVFVTPQSPDPTDADFAFTEDNKAEPDQGGPAVHLSRPRRDRSMILNRVTVKYGYRLDGSYQYEIPIVNVASISDQGITEPLTLFARNTFAASSQLGDGLRNAISAVAGYALTIFARPIVVVQRSFDGTLCDLYPGAACTLTDEHVRSAATGARGISSYPCWALASEWDWSTGRGSVDLGLVGYEDVTARALYSPAADVDETQTNGGYDAGASELTCYAHRYSYSSETADADRFHDGDAILIVSFGEYGGSIESYTRTVDGEPAGNVVTFSGGALGAWTATKKHRIISQTYASAQTSQQAQSYLGDRADGKVNAGILNRKWSAASTNAEHLDIALPGDPAERSEPIWSAGTDLAAEGQPVNPGVHAALCKSVHNFISYKSAPHAPMLAGDSDCLYVQTLSIGDSYYGIVMFPFGIGKGDFPSVYRRKLYVAPQFWRSSGSGTLTCRISSMRVPISGAQWIDAILPTPSTSVTFTTTSTTIQISTRQALDLVADQDRGATVLYVEVKSSVGGDEVSMTGIAENWLGPLE